MYTTLYHTYWLLYRNGHIQITSSNHSIINFKRKNNRVNIKKEYIEIHLEYILHYIKLITYYIIIMEGKNY